MTGREDYRGVGPEGAFAAVAAGGAGGACVLTEVVVAGDGLPAEVAHEAPAPARHPVASLRLDQACPALDALPHTRCCHAFLTATQERRMKRGVREARGTSQRETRSETVPTRRLQIVTCTSSFVPPEGKK